MGKYSRSFQKAKKSLESIKGKKLSIQERAVASVDMASWILDEGEAIQSRREKRIHKRLARMLRDFIGKSFIVNFVDQCFRSNSHQRVADQVIYLLSKFGVPRFLLPWERLKLQIFKVWGRFFSWLSVPLLERSLRREMADVIIRGEKEKFFTHMRMRFRQGVSVNLNHLGEAVLGEEEAKRRLQMYLRDLRLPEVEYISVKISTLCSQLNLLAWKDTVSKLSESLRALYREAMCHKIKSVDGFIVPKFVNLDMEEYRDLYLTVEVFCQVLDEEEFYKFPAGIALQAYLPDSYTIQKKITKWAMQRVAKGGAPIKIRIVKGANLLMEQVEASLHGWAQPTYDNKIDVDANYKRMLLYAFESDHVKAVRIGVASHNLFDIAFALLLRAENEVEGQVDFEMLEGMAGHLSRVVQKLAGGILLYCPVVKEHEFQNAVAYLIRRLDENTGTENFLGQSFDMTLGSDSWKKQTQIFKDSCKCIESISEGAFRTQNRLSFCGSVDLNSSFANDPITDWNIENNRIWLEKLLLDIPDTEHLPSVPLVIGGQVYCPGEPLGEGKDPSKQGRVFYRYYLAEHKDVDRALDSSLTALGKWSKLSVKERSKMGFSIAQGLREKRGELLSAILSDGGKIVLEADMEVSEAIDFVEYYRRSMEELDAFEDLKWKAKGVVLVASPWNFPCSIPVGGIFAALITGNTVIFKPSLETVLVAWKLAQVFWDAGVPKDVLQFISCIDDPVGSYLVSDSRVSCVILTGSTDSAKHFLKLHPGLDIMAETGGKNAIIVTDMADRDLAVKDIVHSAFGHAGQKCSAASLVVCLPEVYNDLNFRRQLKDAVSSLQVGSSWNLSTSVNPLICEPKGLFRHALTQLDEDEEWLLKPIQDPQNAHLWSPGIKLGVKKGSWMHQNELFGPILSVMCADDLEEAIEIVNGTRYGLTSGLQSLDEREHIQWLKKIEAGNCYINRSITGAIVRRQAFGGCKESCFGNGLKPGGPNYLIGLMNVEQLTYPKERLIPTEELQESFQEAEKFFQDKDELSFWRARIASYTFWWHYYKHDYDYSRILGQDNTLRYLPKNKLIVRFEEENTFLDVFSICACALLCGVEVQLSARQGFVPFQGIDFFKEKQGLLFIEEDDYVLMARIRLEKMRYLRVLCNKGRETFAFVTANCFCHLIRAPILANGRVELLYYLNERSVSINYHRYGNLGIRENERRKPLSKGRLLSSTD